MIKLNKNRPTDDSNNNFVKIFSVEQVINSRCDLPILKSMYPSPPDKTSMGGNDGFSLIVGSARAGVACHDGERTGDVAAPGTATKNFTASRWPWKLSWAWAMLHSGILLVELDAPSVTTWASPETLALVCYIIFITKIVILFNLLVFILEITFHSVKS